MVGIIIAILNALAVINSSKYFLIDSAFPVIAWLNFNICAPSVIFYLIGFFSKRREIIAASLPFLAYYGIGGLLVFGWDGYAIIAQIGHIFMALAIVYTIIVLVLEKNWKFPVAGFIISLVIFSIIFPLQQ